MIGKSVTIRNGVVVDSRDPRSTSLAIAEKEARIDAELERRLANLTGFPAPRDMSRANLLTMILRLIANENLRTNAQDLLNRAQTLKNDLAGSSNNAEADSFDHTSGWS